MYGQCHVTGQSNSGPQRTIECPPCDELYGDDDDNDRLFKMTLCSVDSMTVLERLLSIQS